MSATSGTGDARASHGPTSNQGSVRTTTDDGPFDPPPTAPSVYTDSLEDQGGRIAEAPTLGPMNAFDEALCRATTLFLEDGSDAVDEELEQLLLPLTEAGYVRDRLDPRTRLST